MAERFPVVLVDDGELDEVRDLLGELGVEFAHLRGGAVPRRIEPPRDLFVCTMRRANLARPWPHSPDGLLRPVRIAVVDEDSPAARSALRKLGFAYLVRRPVHPLALRLLLLRALYQGDERRGDARVPVGVDVTLRTGLRRRDALLADLSLGGCRLVTDRALPAGAKLTLHLPGELLGESDLALAGRILRCERDAHALADGGYQIAVRFESLGRNQRSRLERFLARRDVRLGPASEPRVEPLRPAEAAAAERGPTAAASAPTPIGVARRCAAGEPPQATPAAAPAAGPDAPPDATADAPSDATLVWHPQPSPASAPTAAAAPATEPPPSRPPRLVPPPARPAGGAGGDAARLGSALLRRPGSRRTRPPERRRHERGLYERRVLAEAASAMHRMLFGRDLSAGGMRVDRHPDLRVGARMRVALYDATREAPIVVDAVVARDDGARGFALQFLNVTPEAATRLEQLVATLPPVEQLSDGEAGALGTVVGEIVS
ncbi:MAG TPA: PilZ domain-containing protein [Myxococcota bacterium]